MSPVSGQPFLSPVGMRCSAYCSGAGQPTPGKLPCNPCGEASRCQSLSRRSPTAPFAQGSHLCPGKYNRLSAGAQYGCSVTLVRWPDGQNSPGLYALLALLLRRWPANAGKSCPAILAVRRRKGRLDAMGLTIPPAWPCHAVPPLHKGGCGEPPLAKLSLPGWTQPA